MRILKAATLSIPLVPHNPANPKTSTIGFVIGDDTDRDVEIQGTLALEPPAPEGEAVWVDEALRETLFGLCVQRLRDAGKLPPR